MSSSSSSDDSKQTMPALYLSHGGGPMPLLGDPGHANLVKNWKTLAKNYPKPKAILVVSAHWEAPKVTVQTGAKPSLLFDYFGFPKEAYSYKYDAPGAPKVAQRVLSLLKKHGIPAAADDKRGFDHGVFVPLLIAYPDADIPVFQVSQLSSLDAASHIELGKALRPLLSEGVMIIGSGMSFHNMGYMLGAGHSRKAVLGMSEKFDKFLNDASTNTKYSEEQRLDMLQNWAKAPHARDCHRREEHLLPLLVVAAASGKVGKNIYSDEVFGARVSGFAF